MRIVFLPLALAAGVLLVSCDQKPKDQKEVNISTPNGKVSISGTEGNFKMKSSDGNQSVEVNTGASAGNVKSPSYAPVFPGAAVQSSVIGNGADGTGGMMAFQTHSSPDEVISYYRAKSKEAGFVESMTANSGGTEMFAASEPNGGKRGIQVTASKGDDGTTAQVFWSGK